MNANKVLFKKGDLTKLNATMRASGRALIESLGVIFGMEVLTLAAATEPPCSLLRNWARAGANTGGSMRYAMIAALLATPSMIMGATPPFANSTCAVNLAAAHVFTGLGFEIRDLSLRDGRFVETDGTLPTVDASKLWLIPPFVDAHTHTINNPTPGNEASHRRWLNEGVFYALNPNNVRVPGPTPPARDNEVDFEAAGGGLTRPGGHPTQLYPAGLDGRAYYTVRNASEARAAVARVKANGSSFVKLYLLNHKDPGGGDGLSAESFEAAVAEAKRLGLRPIAHIEDADDFRLAVASGVLALMHMPYWPPSAKPQRPAAKLMIDRASATAAARKGIIVVPTVILTLSQFDGPALAEILAIERHNLALLRDTRVRIAVGEDFIGDFHDEIAALRSFGLFDGPEMLRMATQNGADLAFRVRRLGHLEEGYEASFLIYRGNPTDNWITLRSPSAGMRAGHILLDDGLLAAGCSGAGKRAE